MNGLKCIRTQCNFSLSELAERLGVSRQLISAWENGKKEIPQDRKRQLSDFFGIDIKFFANISEDEKKQILGKAMFRYRDEGQETYKFKSQNDTDKKIMAYFIPERKMSMDEEYISLRKEQKQLMERINNIIIGPKQVNLQNQICYLNRGIKFFTLAAEIMENCFSKSTIQKMAYYNHSLELMNALNIVLGANSMLESDDDAVDEFDSDEVNMVGQYVSEIKAKIMPIINKLDEFDRKIKENKKNQIDDAELETRSCKAYNNGEYTMEELISMAEESYRNDVDTPGLKTYTVCLNNFIER